MARLTKLALSKKKEAEKSGDEDESARKVNILPCFLFFVLGFFVNSSTDLPRVKIKKILGKTLRKRRMMTMKMLWKTKMEMRARVAKTK